MFRIRMILPKRQENGYRYIDILHDALVNAWTLAGAKPESVTGVGARSWNFAPLGWRSANDNRVHTLVISTPDVELAGCLKRFKPEGVVCARAATGEQINFSGAEIIPDPDPVVNGMRSLGVVMLSPLAVSYPKASKVPRRWHTDISQPDVCQAVNARLSKIAGRPVRLQIQPDSLYLRANPKHEVLIPVKGPESRKAFVIGMKAPLVLTGSEEDLRLAWYAGIGEKTRNGFGCIGLAERGIGR